MMKKQKRTLVSTISDFVSLNSFVIVLLIALVAFHQIFIVGGTVSQLEENQDKMVKYLKENVAKVHFLTASGMIVTSTKSPVSLSDERFKSYVANQVTETFLAGLIKLSSNYKITFASPDDIVLKNKRIFGFYEAFIKPKGSVLSNSMRTLHRAILEKRYPEYVDVLNFEYEKYFVRNPSEETNFQKQIDGTLKVSIVVKSWITELKKWHTVEKQIRIPFIIIVDVDRYAKIDNPFGLFFNKLDVPIMWKPTATEARREGIK